MKVALLYSLLFITALASAQNKSKTIQLDTIHIRGYIYDEFGKPINDQIISSSADTIRLEAGRYITNADFITSTDVNGYFNLCAYFNDTLKLANSAVYNTSMPVYNRGSRYMIITLNHRKIAETNSNQPIQVTALRKQKNNLTGIELGDRDPYPRGDVPSFPVIAHFKGGINKFIDFVKSNIVYPEKAIANNIEGEVKIGFIIEKEGSVVRPWILQGIGYGCDEVVMKAVLKSPKWVPTVENGRAVITTENITVDFKLTDK
jgi:TonB family protein